MTATKEMTELYAQWKDCTQCPLHLKRSRIVWASGNALTPSIFVVGEAPGPEENKKGLPFIGPTGQLLRTNLVAGGIDPDKDCFITNSVLCFPTDGTGGFRGPLAHEIMACRPRLDSQFRLVRPSIKVLLLLGKRAAAAILHRKLLAGPDSKLSNESGWSAIKINKELGWYGGPKPVGFPEVYVANHPSYIARRGANDSDPEVYAWKEDLKAVGEYISTGVKTVVQRG